VPAVISWPGKLAQQKFEQPMHVVDWMPTLCAVTGAKPKHDLHWDGIDVWPQLTGAASGKERTFYWKHSTGQALRDGDWKLIVPNEGEKQLFNVQEDPSEKQDVANEQPDRVASLFEKLTAASSSDETKLPEDLRGLQK
jgi:arylsulfatase A-like enzyme